MLNFQEKRRLRRTALQPVQFIKQSTPCGMLDSLPSGVIRTYDSNHYQCTPKKKIILQASPKRFRPISPILSRNKAPIHQVCKQKYLRDRECYNNCYSPSRMRIGYRDWNPSQQSYQYDLNREYCCNVQKTYPQYLCDSQNIMDKYSSKRQILNDLQRLKKKIFQINI